MTQLSRRNLLKFTAFAGLATAAGLSTSACSGVGGGSGNTEGKTVIRYGFWGNNVRQQNYNKAFETFEAANPEIAIEPEFAEYAAFQERMTTQMAARNVPEIFWIASPQVLTYDKNGLYHDIEGIDTLKLDDFSAEDLESFKLNGKLNTMPFGIFVPVLRYNETEAKKAEVTLPADGSGWSWDAVAETATALQQGEQDADRAGLQRRRRPALRVVGPAARRGTVDPGRQGRLHRRHSRRLAGLVGQAAESRRLPHRQRAGRRDRRLVGRRQQGADELRQLQPHHRRRQAVPRQRRSSCGTCRPSPARRRATSTSTPRGWPSTPASRRTRSPPPARSSTTTSTTSRCSRSSA